VLNALNTQKQEYYEILDIADETAACTEFIEFMLNVMKDALAEYENH